MTSSSSSLQKDKPKAKAGVDPELLASVLDSVSADYTTREIDPDLSKSIQQAIEFAQTYPTLRPLSDITRSKLPSTAWRASSLHTDLGHLKKIVIWSPAIPHIRFALSSNSVRQVRILLQYHVRAHDRIQGLHHIQSGDSFQDLESACEYYCPYNIDSGAIEWELGILSRFHAFADSKSRGPGRLRSLQCMYPLDAFARPMSTSDKDMSTSDEDDDNVDSKDMSNVDDKETTSLLTMAADLDDSSDRVLRHHFCNCSDIMREQLPSNFAAQEGQTSRRGTRPSEHTFEYYGLCLSRACEFVLDALSVLDMNQSIQSLTDAETHVLNLRSMILYLSAHFYNHYQLFEDLGLVPARVGPEPGRNSLSPPKSLWDSCPDEMKANCSHPYCQLSFPFQLCDKCTHPICYWDLSYAHHYVSGVWCDSCRNRFDRKFRLGL